MRSISIVAALGALTACGGSGAAPADAPSAPRPRIVVIADTHIIGPQYTTPVENSPADNESILLTPQRLMAIRDQVNALVPAPEAVFVLGDIVHAAHHSLDPAWYDANPNAYTVARDIFAGFHMPVHMLMGNHDYEWGCGGTSDPTNYPPSLSEQLFLHFFGATPYYAVQVGGTKLYLLDAEKGRTWDPTDPACNTDTGSFGKDQLDWLDGQLADGKPAIVMSHYMNLLWDSGETPSLANVIAAHDNVKMYLSGHSHRWVDLSPFYDYPSYVVGPARYDPDNFWILELDGAAGTVDIVDKDKAIWYNSCAQTMDYSTDPPTVNTSATEMGTCVMGLSG